MSRLIVKNLPKGIKEEKLKTLFSSQGNITDCSLKYTKDGIFRKFAFIGFQSEEEARNAQKYFDKSFIDTSRIQVSLAASFGDKEKPRAWSKYSKDSSAFKTLHKKEEDPKPSDEARILSKAEKKKKAKEERLKDMLGDLKDDPGFEEFLTVHQNLGVKSTWGNDTIATQQRKGEATAAAQMDVDDDSGHSSGESDREMSVKPTSAKRQTKDKSNKEEVKEANKQGLSDLEYLKSKMASDELEDSSSSSSSDEEEESSPKGGNRSGPKPGDELEDSSSSSSDEEKESPPKGGNRSGHKPGDETSSSSESSSDDDVDDNDKVKMSSKDKNSMKENAEQKVKTQPEETVPLQKAVVKMRGFPGNVGEKAITEFFKPLKVKDVKVPKNAKRRPIGVAFIEFLTDKDLDQALRKNKNFIGGKRVFLNKIIQDVETPRKQKARPWELKKSDDGAEEEGIGESGRLYVRNLAYVCTEEQLEELFSKYGLLTEVNLPVDKITKKIKGFAHITFMIPENAVKAYTELDGTVFLGRMMHILPGKPKKEETEIAENSSYKKQKAARQKATAGSSHNWNALFLGANAVADVMADKYGTSKSQILNVDTSQSLGVRMALGETQVVSETRDFLVENGIQLDSFSQPSAPRSKTVILVKNLPVGTKPEELRDVFSKYGGVGRVVLPPSGITAVVEFLEATEARAAFTKLAYTKFKHVPLYLEWAPMEALKPRPNSQTSVSTKGEDGEEENMEDDMKTKKEEDTDSEEDATPQGNVLFVKNLNFETREDGLRKLFEKCGPVKSVTVAKKKDMKNPGEFLSMGYGFVEYKMQAGAQKALKELQYADLDGHQVALKVSNRVTLQPEGAGRKKQKDVKQKSTKILIRNIPFEAKSREILELFKVFGELKSVRLPKKLGGTGQHRGFGFVDFLTKQDAKRAFNALCHSTHLYGRRLVLEWADAEENIEDLRKKTAEHFHDDSPRKRLKKSEVLNALGE